MRPRRSRFVAPTLPELWAFLALALPVVAALAAPMSAIDLAYAVRAGDLMRASGSVLQTDPFTFTVGGQPWLDQQWLAQVLFAVIHAAGGWAALALVRAAVVGVLYAAVFAGCQVAGAGLRTAALLTLVAFLLGAPALAMRAQLLGEVLFAVVILVVLMRHERPRVPWIVPVLVVLWANVHGSFPLGIGVVGVAAAADLLDRRPAARVGLGVLALCLLATGLTPWGFDVWSYALALGTSPVVRSLVTEWQTTSPLGYPGVAFYASVVAVLALAAVRRRRFGGVLRPATVPWLVGLAALVALGAYAERGVVWWAIAAPPAAAWLTAGVAAPVFPPAESRALRGSRLNALVAVVIVLLGVAVLPFWRPATADDAAGLPLLTDAPARLSAAVRSLARPGDRLFVPQAWASWFEYDVPGVPVFVDSRFELFPTHVWEDYVSLSSGSGSLARKLDDWKIALVVVPPEAGPARAGIENASWVRKIDVGGSDVYRGPTEVQQ